METSIKSNTTNSLSPFWKEMEDARYAVSALLIIIMGCLGGLAGAYVVTISAVMLMAVSVSSMLILVLILALAPMRMIVVSTAVAIAIDILVFLL